MDKNCLAGAFQYGSLGYGGALVILASRIGEADTGLNYVWPIGRAASYLGVPVACGQHVFIGWTLTGLITFQMKYLL